MKLKTDIHVNIDLHFTNDDLVNGAELARLAAVCDGLYMLIKAQRQEAQETTAEAPQLAALPQQIEAVAESVFQETPEPAAPATHRERNQQRDFLQFDRLVRAEMGRLAVDGRMPSGPRWNAERDPQLPSMSSVYGRYKRRTGIASMSDLARHFGLKPAPTGAAAHKATNGHEPRRRL